VTGRGASPSVPTAPTQALHDTHEATTQTAHANPEPAHHASHAATVPTPVSSLADEPPQPAQADHAAPVSASRGTGATRAASTPDDVAAHHSPPPATTDAAGQRDAVGDEDANHVPDDVITTLGDVPDDLFSEPDDTTPVHRAPARDDHDDVVAMVQSLFPGRMVSLEPFPTGNGNASNGGEPPRDADNDVPPPEPSDPLG